VLSNPRAEPVFERLVRMTKRFFAVRHLIFIAAEMLAARSGVFEKQRSLSGISTAALEGCSLRLGGAG
jgi:hypothetical protein